MEQVYYLWHCARAGWVSAVGTTTQREQATAFIREEAITRMNRTKDHNGEPTLLPVNRDDLT